MSIIEISGDGFVYDICEDVTRWFLNKYYPRHKIHLPFFYKADEEQLAF